MLQSLNAYPSPPLVKKKVRTHQVDTRSGSCSGIRIELEIVHQNHYCFVELSFIGSDKFLRLSVDGFIRDCTQPATSNPIH